MVEEPYFSIPAEVPPTVIPTVSETPAVNVASPSATTTEQDASLSAQSGPSEPVAQESSDDSGSVAPSDAPLQEPEIEPEPEPSLRRSQRTRRSAIPDDYEVYTTEDTKSDEIYMSEDIDAEGDPTTYEEAMRSENSSKWVSAMEDELESMRMNKVWDLEVIPQGAKTVGCKWVYKTRHDSKGNVERYKARLVAKGFTQREGIDYHETFSPVSTKDSFRIIMALVAHFDLELHQMDVKTAFLNGELVENVYMAQPKGFVVRGKEHMGCLLRRSIYGLKQASRQWYIKFDQTIRNFGFEENKEDNFIYAKFKKGKYIFLVLYVDDVLLASSDKDLLAETKRFLSSNFDMKDIGEASYVLGIEIHRDRQKGVLGLSQKSYIENVLKRYNMHKCNASPSPIVKGDKFGEYQCPKNQYEKNKMKSVPYASAIGSIMYAQVCTRPDLAFTTGMLGRYQKNPSIDHWKAVKKALRYLQGTKGLMLTYRRSRSLQIVGYADADWGGCKDTLKSTLGYIFTLSGGAISWKSCKQTAIASSTMHAEFVATYEATGQAMWMKKFVPGLRVVDSIERPLRIYCDNEPAVFFSHNNKSSVSSKYIDIKCYIVKEKIHDQTIEVEHIRTHQMLADSLTKGLPPRVFSKHAAGMGLRECL
jgi:hypothetical protein